VHTFFHDWRRKTGRVTLVVAVVVTAAWVRSLVIGDAFYFGDYEFISQNGRLSGINDPGPPPFPQYHVSIPLVDNPGFVHFSSCITYWPFAITLVPLSAYLILIPSRKGPAS
jgi:hypothetical protein